MTQANLVRRYFSAWNDHDVDAVLELMHRGAAIYDAFWLESCVGKNIRRYLADGFEDEPYFYELIGDVINTDTGVVYRYSAHNGRPANDDNFVYEGAVALTVHDGLILTVCDFYCNPDRNSLVEVAQLASRRHGLTRHADCGMSANRRMRLRAKLTDFIENNHDEMRLEMTLADVANELGCSSAQLLKVIDSQYGTRFAESDVRPANVHFGDLLPAN